MNLLAKPSHPVLLRDIFCVLVRVLRSKVTMFNIRVWRFLPDSSKEAGRETASAGEAALDVHWHTDHFPPRTFKIMIYLGEVDTSRGCLHIKEPSGRITPLTGYNQVLFFDNSAWLHAAPAPTEGCRDVIELSVMPRIFGEFKIYRAGHAAGYPLTPFSRWMKAARYLKSV